MLPIGFNSSNNFHQPGNDHFGSMEEGEANRSCYEKDLVRDMSEMLERVKLPEDSVPGEQCIYSVPLKIRQVNKKAYTPLVVSIGPIHNPTFQRALDGDTKRLKPMQDVKPLYLKAFLTGSQLSVGDCVSKLKEWEPTIRRYYADPIQLTSYDFLRMVLIDACFIIEHFLRYFNSNVWIKRDPLFSKPWLVNDVAIDLLLLENQLPFFVLSGLYDLAIAPHAANNNFPSFLEITFKYFESYNQQNILPLHVPRVLHFTDLVRTLMLSSSVDPQRVSMVEHLHSASQLLEAGLHFEVSTTKCFLDLEFDKGVLKMPCLKVFGSTEIVIRNIIAFEQCYYPHSPYFCEYIKILDFLIDTEKDVNMLVDKKIIVNLLGDADAVARMINKLCLKVTLPNISLRYSSLCHKLNAFYENPVNKHIAIFKHEYWNTPWKKASTIAAIVLLLLTLIQTICSIVSLFKN